MNQLDLILENIRLEQIEKLYQEAQTDLEIIRGQRLINESMMQVRGALQQENTVGQFIDNNKGKIGVAAGLGAGAGLTYAAGRGHLGEEPQNWIHDKVTPAVMGLYNKSIHDRAYANTSASIQAAQNNQDAESLLLRQPSYYTSKLYNKGSEALAGVTGVDIYNPQQMSDYATRNPGDYYNISADMISAPFKGVYQSLKDHS